MPGIDFKTRFAEIVKAGEKTQTIRKRRTPPIKVGDHLTLWTGMRTKKCKSLMDATCIKVEPIKIILDRSEIWAWDEKMEWEDADGVYGNFCLLNPEKATAFAKADGFDNILEFFEFFANYPGDVLHFELVVIHWRPGWDFKK